MARKWPGGDWSRRHSTTRTCLTFSARAHFLKSGGKIYEIAPQSRYSRFAELRDSNEL
jgi:hypothetical protein